MGNDDKTLPGLPIDPDGTLAASGIGAPASRGEEVAFTEFGNYQILGEIARGGVGVVYRAKQRGLDRVVALKVLQGANVAGSEQIQRFMQEAQSAAKLQHPNIVPIHDFGVHEGQHYFTMDFVEGQSLADRLDKGVIPPREALEITRQVSDALHYAHEHGVVHRDIKPGNILLDKNGRVKVTDFGLAKEMNGEQLHLTVTGQVMGTPRYMSPEQAGGQTARADARSDVFSLGVTLYEMLTGRPAFTADNIMEMLQQVCTADPTPPNKINSKVHSDAATICMKAMEKERERRYQTTQAMSQDIEHFLAGEPIEAKATGPVQHALRKAKRHAKIILVNLALAIVAIYLLIFYLNSRPSQLELHVASHDYDIALDGTPLSIEQLNELIKIKSGKHRLLVASEPDYDPQEIEFTTDPAEIRTLSITLARRKGVLVVTVNPPDAAITIVGTNGFRSPLRGPRIEQELPTGTYSVFVHKENYLAQDLDVRLETRSTNTYDIALPSINLWSIPTSANVQSVPVVGDVAGTGLMAAVAGDDSGNVYCIAAGSGVTKWVHQVGDAVQAPLAFGLVAPGQPALIFAGTTGNKLYCLSGFDGRELWKKPFVANGAILGAILLRDVNGDGFPDAIVGAGDGSVNAISGVDGSVLWTANVKGRIESAIALARIGTTDVVLVGSANKMLSCFSLNRGTLLWNVETRSPLLFPPRFEEIDGQPTVLLPTPKSPGDVRTMTAVSLIDRKLFGVSDKFPHQIDLNGDGQAEQLVVTEAGTTCYTSDGTNVLWQSELLAVAPYAADMDDDGTLDLVFNNGPDELVVISGHDGKLLAQIKLDSATGRGFTLDDIDRDGLPDIIVGVAQRLHCFSLSGGRKAWSTRGDGYYDAPFVNVADRFVTKNNAGEIACYDPQLSTPVWRVKTSAQPSPYSGLAAGPGLVVDADASARLVRAYASATGKVLWQMRLPTKAEVIGTPAIQDETVIVSDGVAGVYAFALSNGVTRWSAGFSNITVAAAIGGGKVILTGPADTAYTMYCLAQTDGRIQWRTSFSDPIPTAPALLDLNGDDIVDVVAFCDNGFIYAIDGKDGAPLWDFKHTETRTRTGNGLVVAGLEAYLATSKGEMICLDLKTGKPRWTYHLKEQILGAPVLADMNGDGVLDVLVGTMKGRIHCISGTGEAELWGYEIGAPLRYCSPLLVKNPKSTAPLVIVGTGPPANGLYCLHGDAPRLKDRGWSGPWKEVATLPVALSLPPATASDPTDK